MLAGIFGGFLEDLIKDLAGTETDRRYLPDRRRIGNAHSKGANETASAQC